MSDDQEVVTTAEPGSETLAGHPPAVKIAGGVRITQSKRPSEPTSETKQTEKEEPEKPNPNDVQRVFISGALVKGDKDFPTEAVKSFHEKPLPAHQPSHAPVHHHINQPRKM